MILAPRKERCTIVRIDANYDTGNGPRSLDAIAKRIIQIIRPMLAANEKIALLGNRGRPVVAPRDSFQRIRQNNSGLQFEGLAIALRQQLNESSEAPMVPMQTVQVPAYRIAEHILLLENLAFDPREVANDQVFARQLAAIGDRYVIDDIRALGEATASIVSMPKSIATSLSDLARKELISLEKIVSRPDHPFVAIVGGSQVAKKLRLIRQLNDVADEILVGGVVANTFLVARGVDLQRSLVDRAEVDTAKQLDGIVGSKLSLPTDFVWRTGRVMDIGPNTRARYARSIAEAKTILFCGPVGVTSPQLEAFRFGTTAVIEAITANANAAVNVLGDDSIQEWYMSNQPTDFPACLAGDVASIDFLCGTKLAGIEAMKRSRYAEQIPVQ